MKSNFLAYSLSLVLLTSPVALSAVIEIRYDSLKLLLEKQSSTLQSQRLETEAAQLRSGYLKRSFFPSLELFAGQEWFKKGIEEQKTQPNYGLELKVNLFNGGRDEIESKTRDLFSIKKSFQYNRIWAEELFAARSLYWNILYTKERIALLESVVKLNEQNSQSASKRIRSGVATESDSMEFDINAIELKQKLELDQLSIKVITNELRVLLNLDTTTVVNFPNSIDHEHNFETVLEHSHEDHEFLAKENDIQSEMAGLNSRKSSRQWLPKVDAVAGYHQLNQREEDYAEAERRKETYIGLRISLSLPDALEAKKESEALEKESIAFQKRAQFQRKESHSHVENELAELRMLHDQVHDSEANILRAEKYFKLTQSEYARGVKNSPDMLSASEKVFEVKNKRLEILKDFNLKKAHVLSKINR